VLYTDVSYLSASRQHSTQIHVYLSYCFVYKLRSDNF